MRLIELRGFVAFMLAIGGIAFAWSQIENRPDSAPVVVADTTTTTTTTTSPPTTTTPDQAAEAICDRSAQFEAVVSAVPTDVGPGPTAQLALSYWTDVLEMSTSDLHTEVIAVVAYYNDYIDLAKPFGFDAAKIIVEGDKERFQQLITRPAPGLKSARDIIAFVCGVSVPDQPSMSAGAFTDLENRLLFPDEDK